MREHRLEGESVTFCWVFGPRPTLICAEIQDGGLYIFLTGSGVVFIYVHDAVKKQSKGKAQQGCTEAEEGQPPVSWERKSLLWLSAVWEEYRGMSMAVFSGRTCSVLRKFYS